MAGVDSTSGWQRREAEMLLFEKIVVGEDVLHEARIFLRQNCWRGRLCSDVEEYFEKPVWPTGEKQLDAVRQLLLRAEAEAKTFVPHQRPSHLLTAVEAWKKEDC